MLIINKRLPKKYASALNKVYEYTMLYLHQPAELLDVNLYFVNDKSMQTLNRDNRGIDKTTDVLSFPMTDIKAGETLKVEEYSLEIDAVTGRLLLGEIFVSKKVARRQAKEYGHSYMREICFLFCHGLLHILGYDHIETTDRQIMEDMQAEIMNACDIKRGE